MYRESPPPARWQLLLIGLFLLLVLPNCWLPELTRGEAVNALMARELFDQGSLLAPSLLGKPTLQPPLCSWILAVVDFFLPLNEFTIRLIDMLSVGGLAILCACFVRRAGGIHAAAIAAASVISCFVIFEKGISGEGTMLFCLLINAAWFTLYHLSRAHRRWLFAWISAHLLVIAAMLAVGPKAIFYFYLPLFFLRRPINMHRRMRQLDHLISFAFLAIVLVLWLVTVPHAGDQVLSFFRDIEPERYAAGYLGRLIDFPLRAVLGFFPWVCFVWPAFCIAFRPLEPDPTFSQFLRTIVGSVFLFFWLIPDGKTRAILPLIGPLAVLAGMNYEILVRRHGTPLLHLARGLGWLALAGSVAGVVYLAVFVGNLLFQHEHRDVFFLSMALLVLAAAVAAMLLGRVRTMPLWLGTTVGVLCIHLVWVSTVNVHDYLHKSPQRQLGEYLGRHVPPRSTVYLLHPGDERLAATYFYIGDQVRRIDQVRELPANARTVHVIAGRTVPVGSWVWIPRHEARELEGTWFRVWWGFQPDRP